MCGYICMSHPIPIPSDTRQYHVHADEAAARARSHRDEGLRLAGGQGDEEDGGGHYRVAAASCHGCSVARFVGVSIAKPKRV